MSAFFQILLAPGSFSSFSSSRVEGSGLVLLPKNLTLVLTLALIFCLPERPFMPPLLGQHVHVLPEVRTRGVKWSKAAPLSIEISLRLRLQLLFDFILGLRAPNPAALKDLHRLQIDQPGDLEEVPPTILSPFPPLLSPSLLVLLLLQQPPKPRALHPPPAAGSSIQGGGIDLGLRTA